MKEASNGEINLKLAFKLTDQLVISRVLQISDLLTDGKERSEVDMLLVITYLQQLRAYFEQNPVDSQLDKVISDDGGGGGEQMIDNKENKSIIKKKDFAPLPPLPSSTSSPLPQLQSFNKLNFNTKSTKTLNTNFIKTSEIVQQHHVQTQQEVLQTSTPIKQQLQSPPSSSNSNSLNSTTFGGGGGLTNVGTKPVTPSSTSNKPKQLYESRRQYMNPFDSDNDDDDCGMSNDENSGGIIEIKHNGQVIDAIKNDIDDTSDNDECNTAGGRQTSSLHHREALQRKSININDSTNKNNDEIKQRAKQLIQKAKSYNHTPTTPTNVTNNINTSPISTNSVKYTQMAKQLIEDAKKSKLPINSHPTTSNPFLTPVNRLSW